MDTPPPADQEQVIWTAHPSQITNIGVYLGCLLVCGAMIAAFVLTPQPRSPYLLNCFGVIAAVALLVFLARWLRTRARTYQVTSERIKVSDGIFNRKTDELELYRVRDYKVTEPFWLRLFGLGNLVISSMDVSSPSLEICAIRDPNGRREELRKYVELCRDKKRVRVTEFES